MIFNIIYFASFIFTLIYNFYVAQRLICKPSNDFVQIFAPPGTGKTTLAAKIVRDANRDNRKVYSNVPIISANVLDLKDLGKYDFSHSILIIDEAGTEVGNRNWHTNLNDDQIKALKLHRHDDIDIYLFSQAYDDIDKKFRELTTKLLLLTKSKLPFFVLATAIRKTMQLINGQIVEFFEIDKGSCFRFFIVNKWAYFNSYQSEELPSKYAFKYLKSDTL